MQTSLEIRAVRRTDLLRRQIGLSFFSFILIGAIAGASGVFLITQYAIRLRSGD